MKASKSISGHKYITSGLLLRHKQVYRRRYESRRSSKPKLQ